MGLFDKLKEPIFLKETNNAAGQLEILKALVPKLTPEGKTIIAQDIRNLEYGIQGENNIEFELRNSHMPMYILRDVYIEDGDLNAQIDYMVITRKICFIIECKNLYGDIEINGNGDFIRTISYNGRKKREGIYSPITQNQRHLELLRKIKSEAKTNFFVNLIAGNTFDSCYKAVVVLANPKTILNAKYAKKEVKNQVIRADQLVAYIKEQCARSKEGNSSDVQMKEWAESFLKRHKETEKDYTKKYQKYLIEEHSEAEEILEETADLVEMVMQRNEQDDAEQEQHFICPRCGKELVLRTARKGDNKGNQFYGCSAFPKCRYIQNI